jgi:hypothetical protein
MESQVVCPDGLPAGELTAPWRGWAPQHASETGISRTIPTPPLQPQNKEGRLIQEVPVGIALLQQARVDIPGSATLRCVAGDVHEMTSRVTTGTQLRRIVCGDEQTAFLAFPVTQTGADIPDELTRSCKTTMGAGRFNLFAVHFRLLL